MIDATGRNRFHLSHKRTSIISGLVLFFIMIFLGRAVELITDWFWFTEVGYENVFTITLVAQLKMALVFGLGFFVIFFGNLFAALKLTSGIHVVDQTGGIQISKL